MLYRFAWRMTGSAATAEDLVQDCFVILLRNKAILNRDRGTLRSLLIGITRNVARKHLRSERSHDELDELNIASATSRPIDTDDRERSETIARVVAALPPLQREVLILAEYEELSLEEIARAVGAELAAVKSRARENLRRVLAPLLEMKGAAHGNRE